MLFSASQTCGVSRVVLLHTLAVEGSDRDRRAGATDHGRVGDQRARLTFDQLVDELVVVGADDGDRLVARWSRTR